MGAHFTSHSLAQSWRWEFSRHALRKQHTRPECLKSKIATIFAMNKRVHREPITLPLSVDEEIDGRCQRPPEFPGCGSGLVERLVREQIPASSTNLTSKLKRRERGINQVRPNAPRCAKWVRNGLTSVLVGSRCQAHPRLLAPALS
jgi:hypothetical protein